MNGKELLRKMELIDPEYIEAADKIPRRKKAPIMWQQWTAFAACLALAVLSGVVMAIWPDENTVVNVTSGDTASLFSSSGIMIIPLCVSLLAAAAIAALIIKKKRKK